MARIFAGMLMALAAFPAALAQAPALPFTIRITQGANVQIVGDGGTLILPSPGVGLPVDGSIALVFNQTGSTSASINSIDLTDSTEFALSGLPAFPAALTPRTPELLLGVRYTPASSRQASGRITVNYTANNRSSSFNMNLRELRRSLRTLIRSYRTGIPR